MADIKRDLIVDVGLGDGGDTAYYLARGYNVVAVDANPMMIEAAKSRFATEIDAGRLTLLNAGIAARQGVGNFWISDVSEWSSFDREIASRDGTNHHPLPVTMVPFSHILQEYGVPYYLKVDIEGNDGLCIDALRNSGLPTYVSVESECVNDSAVLSDDEAVAMLELLYDVGYKRFKLVRQEGWIPIRSRSATRFLLRLADSVARGRLRVRGLSGLAHTFTDQGRLASLGFDFPRESSGPWGEDIPGGWSSFEKAKSLYLRERQRYFASGDRPKYSFWCDWHATY